jgi:hypothetical protein
MNLFTRITAISALLVAPALVAADTFEGRITLTMTSAKGKSMTMNQTIKGNVFRTDMAGFEGGMIMDMNARTMTIIMTKQKMYMVRPMPTADDVRSASNNDRPEHDPDIEATGKTDRILGYTCKQYLVKDDGKVTELWLAPGLGTFLGMGQQGGGSPFSRGHNTEASAKWERVFKGKPGYPLRVVTHDASGAETFRMEVTNIEKGGVSDADLAPPPDFKQFQMPKIPGFGG